MRLSLSDQISVSEIMILFWCSILIQYVQNLMVDWSKLGTLYPSSLQCVDESGEWSNLLV